MSLLPDVALGSEKPLYNIGAVARMTSISMPTLRAWERRYNFPQSQRTGGGHRLYSEKEVQRLQWVKDRIAEGLQTAQAINALRQQEEAGRLTMLETLPKPLAEAESQAPTPHLVRYSERFIHHLLRGDLEEADQDLSEALAMSAPESLILELIAPALTRVGEAWQKGQISVAEEHYAVYYLRQKLVMWQATSPPARAAKPIVLACAPEEWHEGSLLILGALLRRRRWPIAYLGQAVPLDDLAEFVHKIEPSIVVLIAMTEESAAQLVDWPHWLPEAALLENPIVAYGGRIFAIEPGWQERVAGHYLGDDFQVGLKNMERLLVQAG